MSAQALQMTSPPRLEQPEGLPEEDIARLVLNIDGTVVFANDACARLAGMAKMKGQSFLSLARFEDEDDAFRSSPLLFAQENALFTALRSGLHVVWFKESAQQAELQFDIVRAKDGTRYVIASATADDQILAGDIDRLIETQAQEQAQQSTLDHFLDLSNDLLIIASADGTFESINANFIDLLGFSLADLKGRTFLDLVHPDDRASVRSSLQILMHRLEEGGESIIDFDCRLISNEARVAWMEWKHKATGGRIYSVGHDITAQKKHEQALTQRERQLSEAEAIGHMGHWHWHVGQQDIRLSDEIYRIFGLSPAEFKPTLESVNARLDRRDVGRLIQAFQRAIIEQNDHEIDFRIITPDGDTRHVRCQGRCDFDESGDVIALYGIMQDVTQAQLHEQALREAKEAAERAYAAKSQFLANMSHELRTPLNAIIGFSEMMQQQLLGPLGNDRYLDYIKGIRESGEHLLDLITDILDMSKIEAGKYELALEELNIAKIIRLAVHMIEGRAADSGIKLKVDIPDENLKIAADRRAVMQMTLNLLSNAVKFSHPGSHVDIECAVRQNHVALRVKDYGIGIPANKLQTITNPFEQAANQYTRGHEGSGLGLSITKELAEMHGGALHIESQIDVGTTVTIRLPLKANA